MPTTNLGQISSFYRGSTNPTNTELLWYKTTDNEWYYYNFGSSTWELLRSTITSSFIVSDKVLFVSQSVGNDGTAVKGNIVLSYSSLRAAVTAAVSGDLIWVLDGIFNEADILKDGVNYHFENGVIINNTSSTTAMFLASTAIVSVFTGRCIIKNTLAGYIVNISHASADLRFLGDFYIEKTSGVKSGMSVSNGYLRLSGCEIVRKADDESLIEVSGGKIDIINSKIYNEVNSANSHCIEKGGGKLVLDGVTMIKTHASAEDVYAATSQNVVVYDARTNCLSKNANVTELVDIILRDSNVE